MKGDTNPSKPRRKKFSKLYYWVTGFFVVVAGWLVAAVVFYWPTSKPLPEKSPVVESGEVDTPVVPAVVEPDLPPAIDQQALHQFVADYDSQSEGDFSLSMYDLTRSESVIRYQSETLYFPGSIYKLYIAFLAWQDVDAGILDLSQIIHDGTHALYGKTTLKDCLYYMISTSDSPCAEAVLDFYDRAEAETRLRQLGLPRVMVGGFWVSSEDIEILLRVIYENKNGVLSKESRQALMEALADQVYKEYVPAGFSAIARKSYNKTGDAQYAPHWTHNDAAIVELADGRILVAVLFAKNIDQSSLIDFSWQLGNWLQKHLGL